MAPPPPIIQKNKEDGGGSSLSSIRLLYAAALEQELKVLAVGGKSCSICPRFFWVLIPPNFILMICYSVCRWRGSSTLISSEPKLCYPKSSTQILFFWLYFWFIMNIRRRLALHDCMASLFIILSEQIAIAEEQENNCQRRSVEGERVEFINWSVLLITSTKKSATTRRPFITVRSLASVPLWRVP